MHGAAALEAAAGAQLGRAAAAGLVRRFLLAGEGIALQLLRRQLADLDPQASERNRDGRNRIIALADELAYSGWTAEWMMNANSSGTGSAAPLTGSFAAGSEHTLIGYWAPTTLYLSLDGGSFVSTTRLGGVPNKANSTSFDIGRVGEQLQTDWWNGEISWLAAGRGALDNAAASTIAGYGESDPGLLSLPGAASFAWDAEGAQFATSVVQP